MGSAHHGVPPESSGVIDSIITDEHLLDESDHDPHRFAESTGYDFSDGREIARASNDIEAISNQAAGLSDFLGEDAYRRAKYGDD